MPDDNGAGRLDHIERILHEVAKRLDAVSIIMQNDHERHERELKQMLTWQVLTQEKMDSERERLNQLYAATDKRIADLVLAIDQLIQPKP